MAKNTAIPVLKNAKSAEDLEKYLNGMEDKDVLAFYDETQKIQEDQAYRYEEQLEFLEEYMVERKLKEAKPQEQQPKSEMAMGAELYKRAKGLLDSGEQLELSDDELQLLRKYLERMHESLADHTVENYVAEHFPLTVEAESQEEPTITREEQLFNHAKAKFNNGEELDLSPDEVYNIQMHILRMHNYSSYNQEENAAFEQKISQIGKQYFDGKHPDLIEKGVSTDIDDIYYLHMYMERFGIHNTLDFHHTVDKQIREQQGEDAPTLSGKIRYDILRNVDWEDEEEKEKNLDFFRGFSSRERKPTLDYAVMQLQLAGDGEDREEIQNLINILSDQKTQEQQTVENQETAENVVKEPVAEALAPAPQAEQTEELQPEPVRESPTQENPTIERKTRTPQELLDIAMGPNRLQSIEDAMTTQELISLHKHIGNLRPKRNVKLSKKEANDLHIRSSIDRIVLHTLGVKLITPPYQELKDIEKSGEQFLLRDVFRHYQQEDKSNELQVEKALEALNDERHKRGLENLEYRFEYLGMPKNKRPDYQQFLFDKFYEMPTEEVLESIGISNLYTLRKNMEKYLASHEADDNKKTFLNLQINQAINSHRATEKQEKKRRQQEANLPIIEAVYNDIKEHALEGNMTEVLNILQRLQPNQLGLVVQMEQYAAEQVKNEQNEEVKAKLEEIDGHISARISELREERNKERATEQENVNAESGNRVDLYEDITPDNIYDLVFEEPEVIKQALDAYTPESLVAFRTWIQEYIDDEHIDATAPQLETFYSIAVEKIVKEPRFAEPDKLKNPEKAEIKILLETYSVDFTGKPLDNPVYGILMETYGAETKTTQNENSETVIFENTNTNEENPLSSDAPSEPTAELQITEEDKESYQALSTMAKDAFDFLSNDRDDLNKRINNLDRFFDNVEITHDEEWRRVGTVAGVKIWDSYTADDLKANVHEMASQQAVLEVLQEYTPDGNDTYISQADGKLIFASDMREIMREKVLDHMEAQTKGLISAQMQKEFADEMLADIRAQYTADNMPTEEQLQQELQQQIQKKTEDLFNKTTNDLTAGFWGRIKDRLSLVADEEDDDGETIIRNRRLTISDSIAFSTIKATSDQNAENINQVQQAAPKDSKMSALIALLGQRNKDSDKKLAKNHEVLNAIYASAKGFLLSAGVAKLSVITGQPWIMSAYIGYNSAKAINGLYKEYKQYNKVTNKNFGQFWRENPVRVTTTLASPVLTAFGFSEARIANAAAAGITSALSEWKKGNKGVAVVRGLSAFAGVMVGMHGANAQENSATSENTESNLANHNITPEVQTQDVTEENAPVKEETPTNTPTTEQTSTPQHHSQQQTVQNAETAQEEAEIASIKESVKFEVPDIEKESDTFADNSSSSASAIGDFTNASDEEIYHVQQIIAPAEDTDDENILKNEEPELSSDDNTGKIETESEKSVTEPQKTTEETEAKKDENTDFATATDSGLTGEALFTHTSGDTAISVYENGFFGVETKDGEVTQTWNIRVDENGKPFGSIHTAAGERIMTPQQLDYYNRLTSDYLMQNDNPAKDQVFKLYGDIDKAIHPKDDNIVNNQNNETKVTNIAGNRRATLFDNLNKLKADNGVSSSSGSSYDDFIKNIEEQSYLNSRPYNAEVLEQKYGLVRPAAIQEQSYNTHSQVGNNVMNTRSFYSLSRAENGFSITDLDVTKVMVIDADNQAHLLISNGDETPHEMNPNEAKIFLKTIQNNISKEEDIDVYYKVAGTYLEQHPELTENTGNNVETPTPTDGIDLTNLHIIAATERATEFGLTGGDTRLVESGQYQGTVVTKAENGWQIRYPEGNSIILKVENGTLSGMFVDTEDKTTNMKPQEVEQYRQAAADAYKNSQTPYGKTSADIGARSGGMSNRGNSYT